MTNLIPERRVDRNNRTVTRWVKPAASTSPHMQLPAPAALEPMAINKQSVIEGLYNFAFTNVNGETLDIYEMEMPEPEKVYGKFTDGLGNIPQEGLESLYRAMDKASSFSSREIVANLVYHIGDCKPEDKKRLSLLALHSETIVELMDTKCQHVYEAEPFHLINNVVSAAIQKPMDDVSIEVQTEAALTLGIMFPCEYFHDSPRILRNMIDHRERILENHERVIKGADHIRGRNTIDVDILMDMENHFGALRPGTL